MPIARGRARTATSSPRSTHDPAPETWIKYAGGHDIGGGLYHYGARFYQPSTARWTQMDPLQQPGDLRQHGRYSYAASDPVNNVDPEGLIAAPAALPLAFGGPVAWAAGGVLAVGAGIYYSKNRGADSGRDSGLGGLDNDALAEALAKAKGKAKLKYLKEQKFRGTRNKQKRSK